MAASTKTAVAAALATQEAATAAARIAELEAALAAATTTKAKTTKQDKQKAHAMETGDRLAFVVANARPATTSCLCGCGGSTKTRFVPGHDALLKRDLAATAAHGTDEAKAQAQTALAVFGWAA